MGDHSPVERIIWLALPMTCNPFVTAARIIRKLDKAGYEIRVKEDNPLIRPNVSVDDRCVRCRHTRQSHHQSVCPGGRTTCFEWDGVVGDGVADDTAALMGKPLKDGDSVKTTFTLPSEPALLCVNCGHPEKRHVGGKVWNEDAQGCDDALWCPGGDNGRGDGLHTEWEPKAPGEPVQTVPLSQAAPIMDKQFQAEQEAADKERLNENLYGPLIGGRLHFDGEVKSFTTDPEAPLMPNACKAKVTLFKPSGKYYIHEEWRIPDNAIQPHEMERSPDFHRASGGPVLVHAQEPWGYPVLLVAPVEREDGGF